MDFINDIALGLSVAAQGQNLLYCLLGVLLGTLIGVLPGLGPTATIAMLLPLTFGLPATTALIMLAGIFYGAQYGGSTTAILINVPGESTSVVTALDGHQMARKGRAGVALATAAISSFFAGTVATLFLAVLSPPLAQLALSFGPPEYFALMLLGLVMSIVLAAGSKLKAVGMILLGLLLGLVGQDVNSGQPRFTFGTPDLFDGIDFIVLAMGFFGVAEVVRNLEAPEERTFRTSSVGGIWPSRKDLRRMAAPTMRGTVLGSILGVLPGGGVILAPFASYALEKRLDRSPEGLGNGALEGVAAPESSNNAAAQTSFVPMLTLGIPANSVMALMIGAMIIQGIVPGPGVVVNQPELFWGLIASMWVGNLLLLVLNLPMLGLWVRLLTTPYSVLFAAILVFCAVGVTSISYSAFDVWLLALFTFVGYLLGKLDCEPAPLLLGFILGPLIEEYLRRSLTISHGEWSIFLHRPLSLTLLVCTAITLVSVLIPVIRRLRQNTPGDETA